MLGDAQKGGQGAESEGSPGGGGLTRNGSRGGCDTCWAQPALAGTLQCSGGPRETVHTLGLQCRPFALPSPSCPLLVTPVPGSSINSCSCLGVQLQLHVSTWEAEAGGSPGIGG